MALPGAPIYAAAVVPEDFKLSSKLPKLVMSYEWIQWLGSLVGAVDKAPSRAVKVALTGQHASIPLTPLPIGSLPPGLWRLSYYARITTPGTVSSSLEVMFTWTDGAVTQTQTGAAITGNTTATHQFGTLVVRIDANTPISYSSTYASAGATDMNHSLSITAEQLGLDG